MRISFLWCINIRVLSINVTINSFSLSFLQIVQLLLDNGAHIDLRNVNGEKPSEMLKSVPGCKINPLNHISLKCMAATVISEKRLPYVGEVPSMLEEFIQTH